MSDIQKPPNVQMTIPARSSACFKAAGILTALGLVLFICSSKVDR
jgi:hypothetical protein